MISLRTNSLPDLPQSGSPPSEWLHRGDRRALQLLHQAKTRPLSLLRYSGDQAGSDSRSPDHKHLQHVSPRKENHEQSDHA